MTLDPATVGRIKDALNREFGEHNIDWSRKEEGQVTFKVSTGRMVTESIIEADYHSTHWEADRSFEVTVSHDGEITSKRELIES